MNKNQLATIIAIVLLLIIGGYILYINKLSYSHSNEYQCEQKLKEDTTYFNECVNNKVIALGMTTNYCTNSGSPECDQIRIECPPSKPDSRWRCVVYD